MYSHNQIKALLSTIATNHKQINDFGLGNLWELGAKKEQSYPLMWAELSDNSGVEGKRLRITYSLYFMDLVDKGENNEDEVLSDQLRIALDVLATLKTPSYEDLFTIDDNAPLTSFTESTDDEVAGWKIDVTFLINHLSDRCSVPGDALDDPATNCEALLATLSEDAKNSCILPSYNFGDENVSNNLTDEQRDDLSEIFPVIIKNSNDTFSVTKTSADSPYTIPDTHVIDSNGEEYDQPATEPVVCTPCVFEVTTSDIDRFGNQLPTIIVTPVSPSKNWNSYDFADLFLSKLTNSSPTIEAAITQLVGDLIDAGIWAKAYSIAPVVGGNSADHAFNLKYPYAQRNAFYAQFMGSPTHDANGITTNGTTQLIRTQVMVNQLPLNNRQISVYKRNKNIPSSTTWFGGGNPNQNQGGFGLQGRYSDGNGYLITDGTFQQKSGVQESDTDGLHSLRRSASNASAWHRNGALFLASSNATVRDCGHEVVIGGELQAGGTIILPTAISAAYWYIGEALTDGQESDHYIIVQTFQTTLGRQV